MFYKSILSAAALVVMCATGATASTVYDVIDHNEGGSPEHALWFSGSNPPGATGTNANHFLLSNSAATVGTLVVNDNGMATLNGKVLNDDGQGFDLVMNLMVDTTTAYVPKHPKGDPDLSQWTYFSLISGTLTSISSALDSYNITSLMSGPQGQNYGVQMGFGANDKDAGFGLSSWIHMQKVGCTSVTSVGGCNILGGDINVKLGAGGTLQDMGQVPLPMGMALLPIGLGMLGGMRMRQRRKTS